MLFGEVTNLTRFADGRQLAFAFVFHLLDSSPFWNLCPVKTGPAPEDVVSQ